jgi:hypothetical protein
MKDAYNVLDIILGDMSLLGLDYTLSTLPGVYSGLIVKQQLQALSLIQNVPSPFPSSESFNYRGVGNPFYKTLVQISLRTMVMAQHPEIKSDAMASLHHYFRT